MMATTPVCEFGWKAVEFSLPGIDGHSYDLADVAGPNGTLVMFLCNHCPYVKAVAARIVREVKALEAHRIGAIAIMSNDTETYPARRRTGHRVGFVSSKEECHGGNDAGL